MQILATQTLVIVAKAIDENVFKKISCDFMACFAYNNREIPMEIKKIMDKQRAELTNAKRIK